MSRSYKKFPAIRAYYGKSGKRGRNFANRKIRRLPLDYDIPNGRSFKKLSESCDIWDYSFTKFKEWEIKEWEQPNSWKHRLYSTLEEALNQWEKFYRRK